MTLTNIMADMQREQMGSAKYHPNCWMSSDDMMTPTLPRVSASTWRNTARMLSFSSESAGCDEEHCDECEWLWSLPWEWLWSCECEWLCWCECECECVWEPPMWECAWLNANMPNKFTHSPITDTYFLSNWHFNNLVSYLCNLSLLSPLYFS